MSSQHLAKLDIDLLLALDALLEESNVTRAAKRLSIQQSALSARLTRLRAILDDRLFIPSPSGRGVLPTPRALALQPILTKVLQGLKEMVELRDQFDPMTSDRTFTIALFLLRCLGQIWLPAYEPRRRMRGCALSPRTVRR
jgi:DNA-binding transcriptional LysR family regulator